VNLKIDSNNQRYSWLINKNRFFKKFYQEKRNLANNKRRNFLFDLLKYTLKNFNIRLEIQYKKLKDIQEIKNFKIMLKRNLITI
jgi:hypothetical protein